MGRRMSHNSSWNDTVQIHNPKLFSADQVPSRRVSVGAPGDYKPSITQLPGGELLLVAF